MSETQEKPRKYLEYPWVIDWLQWSDGFTHQLGKPDMPPVALKLIAEMKADLESMEKENEQLKAEIERCKEIAERDGKDYSDLKAKLEKAKKTLRYYADKNEWSDQGDGMYLILYADFEFLGKSRIGYGGKRARATLAELEGEK